MAKRPKLKLERIDCDGCKTESRGNPRERSVINELDGKENGSSVDFVFCVECAKTFDEILEAIKTNGLPDKVYFNRSNEVLRELCPHCRYDNILGTENCDKCKKPMKEVPTPTAT